MTPETAPASPQAQREAPGHGSGPTDPPQASHGARSSRITLQRFQAIVLRLGNQMFVRHYLWINYPNDPQLMGIEMIGQAPNGKARKTSCECGVCRKCQHREYMRGYRPTGRLAVELAAEGFEFNAELGIWTVEREVAA